MLTFFSSVVFVFNKAPNAKIKKYWYDNVSLFLVDQQWP